LTCTSAAMSGGMAQKNILSQNRYTMSCLFCDFINEHCLVCTRRRLVSSQEYNVLHLNYFWFSEIEIFYLPRWPHFITGVKSLKAKETPIKAHHLTFEGGGGLIYCRKGIFFLGSLYARFVFPIPSPCAIFFCHSLFRSIFSIAYTI
jgi:hypothetical protein